MMRRGIVLSLISLSLLVGCLARPLLAQTETGEREMLTRGDAIMRITAADFVKQKIGELLSWSVGYDLSKVSRVKLTPTINYVRAVPKRVPPDGRTILEVQASVDDPAGLNNIAGVRADLSAIGRLPNTMLVDNGLYGDETAADGIYTLQTSVSPKIEIGSKDIPVAVANKKGWLALAKTTLDIKKDPVIIEALFIPEKVMADGQSTTTLTVKIDNPGRIEDMKSVTADLRAFGYNELLPLLNDGRGGDAVAGDDIYSLQFKVPDFVKSGEYLIRIGASNLAGGYSAEDIKVRVHK
ncbi:MAG: hypothetical protein JW782_05165 [Candidatus Saganbacteria bacterium]|nr:hypothetical protein [Candidatus Saganbacteria bacterium]